jgi:signal transduction histidine kinase
MDPKSPFEYRNPRIPVCDAESVIGALVAEAIALIPCEGGFAALWDQNGFVCRRYFKKSGPVLLAPFSSAKRAREPQPADVSPCDRRSRGFDALPFVREIRRRFRVRNVLTVPIIGADGGASAFIELHHQEASAEFTAADQRIVTGLCRLASMAIQSAHAHRHSENQLRELSTRLIRAQSDDNRRWAQLLHEGVGTFLTAVKMYLAVLDRSAKRLNRRAQAALRECQLLVDERFVKIRSLSYLLHPPMLEVAGLADALAWYTRGFAERSGIRVTLEVSEGFPRLPSDLETALFGVVQEGLTNVYRHSGSASAKIALAHKGGTIKLEISDAGRGLPSTIGPDLIGPGPGVGLPNMRERVRLFNGSFRLWSDDQGTTITVEIPQAQERADVTSVSGS